MANGGPAPGDGSPASRQYLLERELAARLLAASREERRGLYGAVYDELHHAFPHLAGPRPGRADEVALQLQLLRPLLPGVGRFLEVGAGDGALSECVARAGPQVTAIEASSALLDRKGAHRRLEVLVSDGPPYDVPSSSVDLAFSCHFVEHVVPDDLAEHLDEMLRVLVPGGAYVCVTPSVLLGPHDISRGFTPVASGMHLVEYSYGSLARELRRAGFHRVRMLAGLAGPRATVPVELAVLPEALVRLLPRAARSWLLSRPFLGGSPEPLRLLEQVKVIARRPRS